VVCVDPDPDDRFVLEPLIAEPLYVYAPPGVRVGSPAKWGPWVTFPGASRSRSLMARKLRAKGAPFEVVAESSQPAVLKEMVRLGMGWTVLSPVDAETERKDPIADRTLTLVRRKDRVPNTALATLLDALKERATVVKG